MATLIQNLPQQVDYEVWKGDTWSPGIITADVSGVVINFTGWFAKMEIRNAISNEVALTLTNSSGITLTSLGVISITLTADQTNDLTGEYRYDLQMTNPSLEVKTYIFGTITILTDNTTN